MLNHLINQSNLWKSDFHWKCRCIKIGEEKASESNGHVCNNYQKLYFTVQTHFFYTEISYSRMQALGSLAQPHLEKVGGFCTKDCSRTSNCKYWAAIFRAKPQFAMQIVQIAVKDVTFWSHPWRMNLDSDNSIKRPWKSWEEAGSSRSLMSNAEVPTGVGFSPQKYIK